MWIVQYKDVSGFYYSKAKKSRLSLIFDLVNDGFDRVNPNTYKLKEHVTATLIKL
jgi:hypothetical protein